MKRFVIAVLFLMALLPLAQANYPGRRGVSLHHHHQAGFRQHLSFRSGYGYGTVQSLNSFAAPLTLGSVCAPIAALSYAPPLLAPAPCPTVAAYAAPLGDCGAALGAGYGTGFGVATTGYSYGASYGTAAFAAPFYRQRHFLGTHPVGHRTRFLGPPLRRFGLGRGY